MIGCLAVENCVTNAFANWEPTSVYRCSAFRINLSSPGRGSAASGSKLYQRLSRWRWCVSSRHQGKFALGIGMDEPSDRLGGVLQGLGEPIRLQQRLGGGGKQRPVGLDRRGDLRPEAGLAGRSKVEQVGVRTFQKGFLDLSEQRPLKAREGLHLGNRPRDELDLR